LVIISRHPEIGLEEKEDDKKRGQDQDCADGKPHHKCLKEEEAPKVEKPRKQQTQNPWWHGQTSFVRERKQWLRSMRETKDKLRLSVAVSSRHSTPRTKQVCPCHPIRASLAENGNHAIGKVKELWYAGLILKQKRLSDVRSS
jgi:hypothetical protein